MALVGGQDKGGQLVWKMDDDTIVPVRIMIDSEGGLVPVPTGPGATEEKQDDVITEIKNRISTLNTSAEILGIGGVFDGDWDTTLNFAQILITINSDQNSAALGLVVEFSMDGSTVHHTQEFTYTAGSAEPFGLMAEFLYFRIKYTNGGVEQGTFNIRATLKRIPLIGEVLQVVRVVDDSTESGTVKAILAAKTPGGAYINIGATNGGNLKSSLEELESDISSNNNKQLNITEFDSAGLEINRLPGNAKSFEDDDFVTGESPIVLDCNNALGRNAIKGFVLNDGPGNFTVAFSDDGVSYGDEITRKSGEKLSFDNDSVDSIRITWVSDSAYRVAVK